MNTAPRFSRAAPPPATRHRAQHGLWAAAALLLVTLAVQVSVAARGALAADARWRPWVSAVCGVLHCSIPAWREPGAYSMLRRDVRPLPDAPGTLRVQASFRNDARWPQSWPVLWLRLSDAEGRVIGEQGFTPDQYLPQATPGDVLAPGQSAEVSFLVQEPSSATAAFSFDFR